MRNILFFCLFIAGIVMMAVGCDGPKGEVQKTAEVAVVDSDSIAYYKTTPLDSLLSDKRNMEKIEKYFEELKQLHIKDPADTLLLDQIFDKIEKDSIPFLVYGLWELEDLQSEKHSYKVKILQYCIDWYSEMQRLEKEAALLGITEESPGMDSIIYEYKRILWYETH